MLSSHRRIFSFVVVLSSALACSMDSFALAAEGGQNTLELRPITYPLWGVTTDSISKLSSIVTSLKRLPVRATTRIVFDEFVPATDYKKATTQIAAVSNVMGELLDSYYVRRYSVSDYVKRTNEYLDTLGSNVDIWEIGNEINGEWLGQSADVVAKMSGAYDAVKARGGRAALTLYYNQDCWERRDHEMFTWAQANIPDRMKQGLDFVFVSYYEDDCNGLRPNWGPVFDRLAALFPNSKIGFGEVGTAKRARKAEYVRRYYKITSAQPNFVRGYFWWYFHQDMVPYTKSLWKTLSDTIRSQLPTVSEEQP